MSTSCAHSAHVLLMTYICTYIAECGSQVLLMTYICTYIAECGSQVRKMSAAQKQIAYIMYAAHVPDFCKGYLSQK